MRWTVHGERSLYDSEWMSLAMVDVELPSGARFEHHVLRMPAHAAGVVVDDRERGVLLLWRHRFITDTWGWEVPAGRVDAGEAGRWPLAQEHGCLLRHGSTSARRAESCSISAPDGA